MISDQVRYRAVFEVIDMRTNRTLARIHNLVNTQGRTAIQKAITHNSPAQLWDYICISTSTTPPAAGDTALGATVLLGKAATKSYTDTNIAVTEAIFDFAEAIGLWSLAGIANAADGTGLIASGLLSQALQKTADDQWKLKHTMTLIW
jgi:hypothetical protein